MTAISPIPPPLEQDPEDVFWALSTATTLWNRAEHTEALRWLQRAADQASSQNAPERARELDQAVAELAVRIQQQAAPAKPAAPPAPPSVPATPSRPPPPPPRPSTLPHAPPQAIAKAPPAPGSVPRPVPSAPPPLPSRPPPPPPIPSMKAPGTAARPPSVPAPPPAPISRPAASPGPAIPPAPRIPHSPPIPSRAAAIAPLPKRARTATRDGERSAKGKDPARTTGTSKRVDPRRASQASAPEITVAEVFDDLDEPTHVMDSGAARRAVAAAKQGAARKPPEPAAARAPEPPARTAISPAAPTSKPAPAALPKIVPVTTKEAPKPQVQPAVAAARPPEPPKPQPKPAETPKPQPQPTIAEARPAETPRPPPQRKGTMQTVDEGFESMLDTPAPAPPPVPPPPAPPPPAIEAARVPEKPEEPKPPVTASPQAIPSKPQAAAAPAPLGGLLAQRVAVIAGPGGEARIVPADGLASLPAGAIVALVVPLAAADGETLARLLQAQPSGPSGTTRP